MLVIGTQERFELDERLKVMLDNIEENWFGCWKGLLSPAFLCSNSVCMNQFEESTTHEKTKKNAAKKQTTTLKSSRRSTRASKNIIKEEDPNPYKCKRKVEDSVEGAISYILSEFGKVVDDNR